MEPPPEDDGAFSDETLEAVFSHLKPFCVQLLDLLQNPKRNASFLLELAELLRRAPAAALQPCIDYTLFPLLLLLDAAVGCRSGGKGGSERSDSPFRVLAISDSVAEGLLVCLEEVLKKCHLGSVDQMVVLLKKLTSGALLSPSEASEEFREGILKCLRGMLLRLQPCSMDSCSCRQITYLPSVASLISLQEEHATPSKCYSEPQECLLAFLRSQDSFAAVGHWLSLLLQTAEVEAARGHHGSANLRKEAFITLRVLVAKVGTADALAFFLPGIVSRFTKVLYVSKSMISGAAGSTGSIEHAVRGLAEFLMIVLNDEANLSGLEIPIGGIGLHESRSESTQSVLEALRHLPVNVQNQPKTSLGNSFNESLTAVLSGDELRERSNRKHDSTRSLFIHRTKEWIDETSMNVDKLLSATFPHLCVYPAEKVRKALVDGVRGILANCSYTLKRSKLMLLECLCVLVFDDSEAVSIVGQESLESLFLLGEKFLNENELSEIFTSFIGKLSRVVLGSEEMVAVSHARQLLALLYYAGPKLIVDHLLRSPVIASHFLDVLGLTMGHNAQYAGSINKLISSKPLSVGYLLSVAELKSGNGPSNANHVIDSTASFDTSKISVFQDSSVEDITSDFEFPRMPPWFIHVGSQKLYLALAGILRLTGLSLIAGNRSDIFLSVLIDTLLDYFRKLISELRMREYSKEGWQTWFSRSRSGQLVRQTSVAACMLNEIIYGTLGISINSFSKLFSKTTRRAEMIQGSEFTSVNQPSVSRYSDSAWMVCQRKDAREHIIHCIGSILHEYLSPELWNLPVDQKSPLLEHNTEDVPLHFLRDTTMLHQVIIDGIGIFSMVLGKDFVCSGFMHSSLYLLLQNLIYSSNQIRSTSDAVLRVLSSASGHTTVAHLVVANADYIIDSLCRQLRHLDLNPHVADVLAAVLSYIGATREILPLLEEPMRAISLELEVLGRHQHPHLTVPFLKAVSEITKASRREVSRLSKEAESFYAQVNSMISSMQRKGKPQHGETIKPQVGSDASKIGSANLNDFKLQVEYLEELLLNLNEMKSYRRIIGSLVGSCLGAVTPLLSSLKEPVCLLALDIIEDVTLSLAKVEEAYKHEKETKMVIEREIWLCSISDLQETVDAADEGGDENRLLPAMNKIWPFLVLCLKNRVSLAVVRKCTIVMSRIVQISGGDFFARRFHQDGSVIWKLLTSSPFRRKPTSSGDERQILLPYRTNSVSSEEPMAEISSQKIQAAVLEMIAEISSNKRSAVALEVVRKKVSGLVVGIACSSMTGLRDASIKALSGLTCIDPDLIWLLLADVYYSLKKKDIPMPPASDLAELSQLLPLPSSSKEYLYVQYGGGTFGFDIDFSSVEIVFQRLQSEVFT